MQRPHKEREGQDYRRTDHPRDAAQKGEEGPLVGQCSEDKSQLLRPRGIESKTELRKQQQLAKRRNTLLLLLLVSFAFNVAWLSAETLAMASEKIGLQWQQESAKKRLQAAPPSSAPSPRPDADVASSSRAASTGSLSAPQGVGVEGDLEGVSTRELDKVWTRFERSVEFPSSGICGTWPEPYARTHAQMRAGDLPPYYLTFRPTQGGFPENLLGIVSAFVAALLSNRTFLIEPSANFSLGPSLLPSQIDWELKNGTPGVPDVPLSVTARHRLEVKEGDVFLLRRLNLQTRDRHRQVSFPRKPLEYFRSLAPATNVIVESNGGVLARIFSSQGPTRDALHALGMRMPYAFGCIVRFLFRPTPEVMQLLRGPVLSLHKPGTEAVCVHARTTDALAWSLDDPGSPIAAAALHPDVVAAGESLLGCAKRIGQLWLPQRKPLRWLFLSDSHALGDALRMKLKGQVLGSGVIPQHLSLHGPASLPSTVADWLLLSSCKHYVITESAFAKTAVAFNLSPFFHTLFHVRGDEDGFKWRAGCDGTRSSSLLDYSQLSGL